MAPSIMATRRHLLALGAAGAGLAAFGAAPATAQTRWQMATPYPDSNFHTRNIRRFLEEVQQGSGGRLQVQVHTNGSLLKMPEIKRGVQTGQAQLGEILLTAYANEDPFFDADAIPQLVTNFEEARRLSDLQKPYIENRLNRQGLVLLYMVPWPPAGFYTQEPLQSIEGLRGTRMRTFSVMTNRFATLVGATPTLVQSAEVPQAFATGVVNAQVTSAASGVDTQAWDYAKVFTPVGFSMTKNAVIASRRTFDALPADLQQAIRAAAQHAEQRGYTLAREAQTNAERKLAEQGMQVAQPTPELLQGLRQISRTMQEEWIQRAGEDGRKLLEAYRGAA